MKSILTLLKGFVIGVAKIIPGISGSVLALSLGVYEKVLNIAGNIREIRMRDIIYLFWLMIGILLGITLFAGIVKFFLNKHYLMTMALFIGMIAGGIPSLVLKTKFNFQNIGLFIIAFAIIILIEALGSGYGNIDVNGQLYFNMGITEAFTTLIPGISGTAIFMAFGWYETLLDLFTGIGLIKTRFSYLLLFVLGFAIVGFIIMKIINYFLNNHTSATYSVILGFMMGSLFLICKDIICLKISVFNGILGVILFIVGLSMNKIIKYS